MAKVIQLVDSTERSLESVQLLDTARTFMQENIVTETMVFMKLSNGTYHRLNTLVEVPASLVTQLELAKFDILFTMHRRPQHD